MSQEIALFDAPGPRARRRHAILTGVGLLVAAFGLYLVYVKLDEKNQLRKVTFDLSGVKADMTMSKYGEPVDVTAPPAADTVKAPM